MMCLIKLVNHFLHYKHTGDRMCLSVLVSEQMWCIVHELISKRTDLPFTYDSECCISMNC